MSVNGWIDGKVMDILQALGIELPGGDGDKLRTVAGAWDTMGNEISGVSQAIDTTIHSMGPGDWSGPAYDAFLSHWGDQKKAFEDIAKHFHEIAKGLRDYADQIDSINESIIDIATQIAEMEVAGAALSLFTGFVSDLVANTAVAAKAAKILDLVKLFTAAAEKVTELLKKFFDLSEEMAATIEKFLTAAAEFGGKFGKNFLKNFATNLAADYGSAVGQQALSGQPITYGTDFTNARRAAAGTSLFVAGGASAAEELKLSGTVGNILTGEGRMGNAVNGGLGNIVGGFSQDLQNGSSGSTLWQDAVTNAITGSVGNASNKEFADMATKEGMLGGKNRSDKAKLRDAALEQGFGTGLNAAIYSAGSGIETDAQNLAQGK
ncbi:WXG100 family type VII secretion target [Kitasatospora sp. NBC_01250]|uniref:WXG100 family type VII secretion target n=1 Tax=unclassified Kitasatospora TaxID=2633591 RepID=UPI002E1052C7|nr:MULTISPECIES: WXG100 family type VII secretion target [unclassified Kitasatospora]WSJ65979.1 WXG100 family type VII secretion target [Kitasatospora sp. NBC_01302]